MKRTSFWYPVLSAWLLSAAVGIGSAFCLGSAFRLTGVGTDLALGLGLGTLVLALLQAAPRGGLWTMLLWTLGGAGAALLAGRTLYDSLRLTLSAASEMLALGYPALPVLSWGGPVPGGVTSGPFLLLVGLLLGQLVVWTVMQRQSALPAVLFGVIPVALCHLLTDRPPAQWALLCLVGGLCLLLLSQGARRRSAAGGGRTALALALPLGALLAALTLLIPREGYTRAPWAEQAQERLLSWAAQLTGEPFEEPTRPDQTEPPVRPYQPDSIFLGLVGPQRQTHSPVLEITADETRTLYLRGKTYDRYTGRGWTAWEQEQTPAGGFQTGPRYQPVARTHEAAIRTYGAAEAAYVPYYPLGGTLEALEPVGDRYLQSGGSREYTVFYMTLPNGGALSTPEEFRLAESFSSTLLEQPSPNYEAYVLRYDLELPEETRQGILEILAEQEVPWTPEGVAEFLQGAASYDLNTSRAPLSEDFVLWFLRESETGYCVHFASAATVMLRAIGIPARYVTGYVAYCRAGQTVQVTSDTAHAWTEYYENGNWIPLEVTPGGAPQEAPEQTEPVREPTDGTEPGAERPTQAPSAPEQGETEPSLPIASGGKAAGGLRLLAGVLGGVLLLLLRRRILLGVRRARLKKGGRNARCLGLWGLLQRQVRAAGLPVPREVQEIAQKARFSQHEITREELERVLSFQSACLAEMKKASWPVRLYRRYLLVLD